MIRSAVSFQSFSPVKIALQDISKNFGAFKAVTMGISASSILLVVHHTFREETMNSATVRLISSRKATRKERQQYTIGE